IYVVDWKNCTRCGKCVKVCPTKAINLDEKPTEKTIKVGMIVVTTGFEPYLPRKGEFGYGLSKNVITQSTLERLFHKEGPTKGKFIIPSSGKTPKAVSFIMCVGSRQESKDEQKEVNTYCSRFCCSSALKNALLIKETNPKTEVYILYRDIRTFGRGHEKNLYRKCRDKGILFIRFTPDDPPKVDVKEDGRLLIRTYDKLLKVRLEILSDLLVLVEGMMPRKDAGEVQFKLSITRSPDGFFQEEHPKMNPLDTFADGVYIGGTAQGPKDIIDTVNQASGAAGKAAILLSKGKVLIDLVTAIVDEDLCVGCAKCTNVCPYKAITLEGDIVKVIDVKCKGCGSCSATCPIGAIQVRHYRDEQYLEMLEGLITKEVKKNGG
ncbi:MAG: 4Fe-4S binding protein, partial [Candidatus Sifarchaeia archaeon]